MDDDIFVTWWLRKHKLTPRHDLGVMRTYNKTHARYKMQMEWGIGGLKWKWKILMKHFNSTKKKVQSLVPHKVKYKLWHLFIVFWIFWKMPIVIHSLTFMKIYYSSLPSKHTTWSWMQRDHFIILIFKNHTKFIHLSNVKSSYVNVLWIFWMGNMCFKCLLFYEPPHNFIAIYMFLGFLCQGLLSSMSSYITLMFPVKKLPKKRQKSS